MATKRIKTNTKRDVGDPTYDLIRVFEQKDIGEMSEEEFETRIKNLQAMRLIRVTTAKKKTALDKILRSIDVDRAKLFLQQSEETEAKEQQKTSETK